MLREAEAENSPIRLRENVPLGTMFRLSELKLRYPGIYLVTEARRYYPEAGLASHLIGYVGKMSPGAWKRLRSSGYRLDSMVGRLGIEKVLESSLRGRDGGIRLEVDALGRLQRLLGEDPSVPGDDVRLTVDRAVQRAAEEGLARSETGRGAVVAVDPRDGSILAMASMPGFNPNDLMSPQGSEGQSSAVLHMDEFNRAIAGTYPPGSTFKTVVGAAGLNEGRFTVSETVDCPGYFLLGSRLFLCWKHQGHGVIRWFRAIAQSCDVFFYEMGLKTGAALIERYAALFGLGRKTGVALDGEKAGRLDGPAARKGRWYDGDTVNLSIGQGRLLVTPIQMAVMAAAVANKGDLWKPHFTGSLSSSGGETLYTQKPALLGRVSLQEDTWRDLDTALRLAVSSAGATGVAAAVPGLDVRGKTGTAQNPHGEDHAWFVGYASRPGSRPRIAVAVIVENGGHGASMAAPVARRVIEAALAENLL